VYVCYQNLLTYFHVINLNQGLAGMVSQFAVYPLDTLKFRMQCETTAKGLHGNALIIQTAGKMWRQNGIVAFYRGLPMGLIGIFPYAAIDMGTFEYLKRRIAMKNAKKRGCHEDDAQPSSFATACVGGFSGALGASMVYPLNLLRTRLQSQGTILHPRTYTGITDVFHQTIKGEGVRGLFKGLAPNLLKVVPAVSITWVVYENCKKQMNLH
jgi:solute carrier family 25 phosphate transporter 23/24/25/41